MTIHHQRRQGPSNAETMPSLNRIKGDTLRPLVEAYLEQANSRNLGYLRGLRTIEKTWRGIESNVEYLTSLLEWLQENDSVRSEPSEEMPESGNDLEPVTE